MRTSCGMYLLKLVTIGFSFAIFSGCGPDDFFSNATVTRLKTGIASTPDQSGDLYFQRFVRNQPSSNKAIHRCILQHGFGLADTTWSYTFAAIGKPRMVAATFAKTYFSAELILDLLEQSCSEVYLAMQDSANSRLIDAARRIEALMKHLECSEDKPCSLFGHSMGGAAAYLVMERCAETSSSLGAGGCSGLKRVYTAAAPIMGTGSSFLIVGSQLTQDRHLLGQVSFSMNVLYYAAVEASRQYGWLGIRPSDYIVNIAGEYRPNESYPAWHTFDPYRSPGFESNALESCSQNNCGWLSDSFRYAASSGSMNPDHLETATLCPGWPSQNIPSLFKKAACHKMILIKTRLLQSESSLARSFELGLKALRPNTLQHSQKDIDQVNSVHNLVEFKRSDAIVEPSSALYRCQQFQNSNLSFVTTDACAHFDDIIHPALAGWTKQTRSHIVKHMNAWTSSNR